MLFIGKNMSALRLSRTSNHSRLAFWLFACVLVGCLLDECAASHFRGAHFWWQPLLSEGRELDAIEISVRISWRRDYSERTFCNQTLIDKGGDPHNALDENLIGPVGAGYIMCHPDCGRVGNMDFICTDFSDQDDWVSGLRTHIFEPMDLEVFHIEWRGRSWLEEVLTDQNDVDWSFITGFDLRPRPDNGAINTSPRAAVGTLFRAQQGCEQSLVLPIADEDGDRIACRWASGNEECGGICGSIEGFTLHPHTCSFTIADSNPAGKYALAIQIEDFLWNNDSYGALSSVPLQFIVHVFDPTQPYDGAGWDTSQTLTCDLRPYFISPSPVAEGCTTLEAGVETSRVLVARTRDAATSIKEINTVSSVGMRKTNVDRYGDDPRDFYVTVTWTPQFEDIGEHIFCFTAIDNTGLSSDQRCVFITVGGSGSPVPTPQRMHYDLETSTLMVDYSTMISVSPNFREIDIYLDDNDDLIRRLDNTNPELVYAANNTLYIIVSLPEDEEYYLLLDGGIVTTGNQCGRESDPVTDKNQLYFTTAPITPAASTTSITTKTTTASKLSTSASNEQSTEFSTEEIATKEHASDLSTTLSQTRESNIVLTTSMTEGYDILHTSSMTEEGSDMLNTTEKIVDVQTTAAVTESQEGDGNKDADPTGAPPSPDARKSSSGSGDDDDFLWIIIVVVVVVVIFFILLVIIAILVRRHMRKESDEYDREARQEQYLRSLEHQTKIVGYDGPYAPNFHDIEVKFR